jgi:hypothetical protein
MAVIRFIPARRARALRGALPVALVWLMACEPPPLDTGRTPTSTGPLPFIRPLNEVLAETDVPGLEPTDTAALQARASALQARAGAIQATEADPATRARLDAALAAKGN